MKYLSLATACLLILTSAFAQEADDKPSSEDKSLKNYLQAPPNPAVYPLTLIDGDKLKNLTIMDREVRPLSCTLKNISDKPVLVTRIATTCSCLGIKTYTDITLKPGDTLPVEMTLFGRLVKKEEDGFFGKQFVVFTDNYVATFASVEGHVKNMLSFEPSQAIDLGEFIGDVNTWKRIITVNTLFNKEDISLKPTTENKFFIITSEKKGKDTFDVIITPKTPFPINAIRETILMEVVGMPNYDPIPIKVYGSPKGINFVITSKGCTIHKSRLNLDEPATFKTKVSLATLLPQKERAIPRRHASARKNPGLLLPVSKEEDEARSFDNPDTWTRFIPDLSAAPLPEGVKVDFTPDKGGITVTFTFSPVFLKSDKTRFSTIFKYKEKLIDYFDVKVH